jgi:hypothetical protein
MVIKMSKYFNAITGNITNEDSYPDELCFCITSRWYPLYDYKGDYAGAIIDNTFMNVEQMKNTWSRFA